MIIGHQKQWEFLTKCAGNGKLSHAYLFCGQEKLGKKQVAFEWINSLFGQELKGGWHPDLKIIEPEEKEIHIKQVRDLIWSLSLKPHSAPLKAAIIDKAQTMNLAAQASFLKTLEEPRGDTLIILVSEKPELLLPTIVSRVQTVKFYPVAQKEIGGFLTKKGVSREKKEEILKIALGRPGVALDFIADSEKLDKFNQKSAELKNLLKSDLFEKFQQAKSLAEGPQDLKDTLDIWLSFFRERLLLKIKKGQHGGAYSLDKLKNILKQIQATRFLISTTNVNLRLALENLMLEF